MFGEAARTGEPTAVMFGRHYARTNLVGLT